MTTNKKVINKEPIGRCKTKGWNLPKYFTISNNVSKEQNYISNNSFFTSP